MRHTEGKAGIVTRTWSVRYSLPKTKERQWALNGVYTCCCDTIEEAIALVRAEHPDAAIYNVNHKGSEATLFSAGVLTIVGNATVETDTKSADRAPK